MGLLTDNSVWVRNRMANAQLSDKLFEDYRLFATHFASVQWRAAQAKFFFNQYLLSSSSALKNIPGRGFESDC